MQLDLVKMHLCQNNKTDANTKKADNKERRSCLPFPEMQSQSSTRQHKKSLDQGQNSQYFDEYTNIDMHDKTPLFCFVRIPVKL